MKIASFNCSPILGSEDSLESPDPDDPGGSPEPTNLGRLVESMFQWDANVIGLRGVSQALYTEIKSQMSDKFLSYQPTAIIDNNLLMILGEGTFNSATPDLRLKSLGSGISAQSLYLPELAIANIPSNVGYRQLACVVANLAPSPYSVLLSDTFSPANQVLLENNSYVYRGHDSAEFSQQLAPSAYIKTMGTIAIQDVKIVSRVGGSGAGPLIIEI